jgi:hypothetical protein
MLGELTVGVANGEGSPWSYRGWVMTGVDPGVGINVWDDPGTGPLVGTLNSWGQAGSLHSGGCFFAMGDGSVRFVSEATTTTVLGQASRMGDNTAPFIN